MEIPIFKDISGDIDMRCEMLVVLEDINKFKIRAINNLLDAVNKEISIPYWVAVYQMSNYTNWGIYSEISAKNITQPIQDHFVIFWEKRNKNFNS